MRGRRRCVEMQISRGRFAASLAFGSAGVFVRYPAGAAEYSYKLSLQVPLTYPCTVRLLEAAQKILHDSAGRFEIKLFPNGSLGIDTQVFSQARLGAVEFVLVADAVIASVVSV